MIRGLRALVIGILIVTHIAEFGSVALFVLHIQSAPAAIVDHFILIELACCAAIILDFWLLLILFDLIRTNSRMDKMLWFVLAITSLVFPTTYLAGVNPAESPYVAATSQRLSISAVLPLVAWLIRSFWKQPKTPFKGIESRVIVFFRNMTFLIGACLSVARWFWHRLTTREASVPRR
jgi:hypothetical protein